MKSLVVLSFISLSLFAQCGSNKTEKKSVTINSNTIPEPVAPIEIGQSLLSSTFLSLSENVLTIRVNTFKQGQGGPIVSTDENLEIDISNISSDLKEQVSKLTVNSDYTFSIRSKRSMDNENGSIQLVSIK